MDKKLLIIFLFTVFSGHSQLDVDRGVLFSEAISTNIQKYTANSQYAYAIKDFDRAEFLYDSLVNNVIKGTYLDNFKVRKLNGKKIELTKFEKPIFLITYASWCTPGIGEIPALNEIAKKNYKNIDFVVLFWDTQKNARKSARAYSNKINIIYVDEKENVNNDIVGRIKHTLGLPTSFLIDKNKRIVSVKRAALHFYNEKYEVSFDLNYKKFERGTYLLTNVENNGKAL